MSYYQTEILLPEFKRGFHLITDIISQNLKEMANLKTGVAYIFIKHTSASLTINENADPTVRTDFESFFNKTIAEDTSYFIHTYEGSDDMPAHIKSSLLGSSVTLPITNGKFNLGTWQGIYLCEHRNRGGRRKLVVTVSGST